MGAKMAKVFRVCLGGAALALLWTGALEGSASADGIGDIDKKLDKLSAEVGRLSSGIRKPSDVAKASSPDTVGRRLIDAQVNFSVGNYDDAAIVLYDLVERYPSHAAADEALYYLAESLFQKGDTVAARTYFTRLVSTKSASSKFYRQSLERLIELALLLDDTGNVDAWLAALDQVPGAEQQSSVPYVRGKYYYFRKDYDKAIPQFTKVIAASEYFYQARYFLGVSHTGKGDLGAASQIFQELIRQPGKTDEHKRIIELSHMAIGRLYYERDQPARAIDAYLNISRRSDLFSDALFEASWVYVKNKEFNKALRALELLSLSDPTSYRLPEVRILEANLRIRRAQALEGTSDGNPEEEYTKARKLFDSTHSAFDSPHDALKAILVEKQDPRLFMEQITGRASAAFQTQSVLPKSLLHGCGASPRSSELSAVESDLAQIEGEIEEAEQIVSRLERAIFSPSRVNIFPSLASKRIRGTEILEEILDHRASLASEARRKLGSISATDSAELERLAANRRAIEAKLKTLPDSEASFGERISRAKGAFDAVDQERAQIATIVQHTEAQLVAIERYLASGSANITAEDRAEIEKGMAELRIEVDAMRAELSTVRRDLTLGRDQAGTGDQAAEDERRLRLELRAALDGRGCDDFASRGKWCSRPNRRCAQESQHSDGLPRPDVHPHRRHRRCSAGRSANRSQLGEDQTRRVQTGIQELRTGIGEPGQRGPRRKLHQRHRQVLPNPHPHRCRRRRHRVVATRRGRPATASSDARSGAGDPDHQRRILRCASRDCRGESARKRRRRPPKRRRRPPKRPRTSRHPRLHQRPKVKHQRRRPKEATDAFGHRHLDARPFRAPRRLPNLVPIRSRSRGPPPDSRPLRALGFQRRR